MEKFFTGDKNVDSMILKNLDDESLFKICLTGKYGKELCDYAPFWYERLKSRFPYFLKNIRYKDSKKYYLRLVKTIDEILRDSNIKSGGNISQNILENLSKEDKYKVLKLASEKGHLKLVEYLVENGADVNTGAGTALRNAIRNGNLEIVKYLVQNGAKINTFGYGPIRLASANGRLEVIKYLVENGANIHVRGEQPLRLAARNGHLEVVKYLVENGADIHAENDEALRMASSNGHSEIAEYLRTFP